MRRFVSAFLVAAAVVCWPLAPARSYTLQYDNSTGAPPPLKWPTQTVNIALSTSLQTPPANIRAGSDVVGAARRALARWGEAANIQFNVTFSDTQLITPAGGADNESLISVSAANTADFQPGEERPGVTRVFFDPNTNAILAADIALNPFLQFSTDGSPDTYDLESTFVHELGHLLGLEHSAVLGASMMPRQGKNITTYNLPAQTSRTLSDDDRTGMRALYGPRAGLGTIAGTISTGAGGANPVFGAHVWAEEISTGRVKAGNVTLPNGTFRIEGLPPGQYRVVTEPLDEPVAQREIPSRSRGAYGGLLTAPVAAFRTAERSDIINVAADAIADASINFPITAAQTVNAALIGTNDILSTVPVPLVPGRVTNVLVGGNGMHQVGASGISVGSPFVTVDRSSYQQMNFGALQVISFNVNVSPIAPPGEYSLRLQATNGQSTGELTYVSGGLTVDLPNGTNASDANLIENSQFFVAQHYRDFLNREPDAAGLSFWTGQLTECGTDAGCREARRINVSAAFFLSTEFQETGYLVYRFYDAAFNRFPRFAEFLPDTQRIGRDVVVNVGNWQQQLEQNKQAYAVEFVTRAQFLALYPATLSPEEFVDRLNANTDNSLSADERNALVNDLRNGASRATVLRRVAEDADLQRRELSRAFVLMQYFGYLRRNPDDFPDTDFSGYNFWLAKLNEHGGNYIRAELIKAFITSPEYRRRFGQN